MQRQHMEIPSTNISINQAQRREMCKTNINLTASFPQDILLKTTLDFYEARNDRVALAC